MGHAYYFCGVGPIGEGDVLRDPGRTYGLRMDGAALRAPARRGIEQHAVVTDDEIGELRRRGFSVTIMQGPFATQKEAEDCLDSCWEEPE